jgi:hypothetical protein
MDFIVKPLPGGSKDLDGMYGSSRHLLDDFLNEQVSISVSLEIFVLLF